MDERELDDLLDESLAARAGSAPLPPELVALTEDAETLRSAARAVDAEAAAAMPVARARFERFLAVQADVARPRPVAVPSRRRTGRPWVFGFAGALAVIALLAVIGARVLFDGAESATALTLEPGDYAQFDGLVVEASDGPGGRSLTLDSAFGRVDVDVPEDAGVMSPDGLAQASEIVPGVSAAVSGEVGADRRVTARMLSFAAAPGGAATGSKSVRTLEKLDAAFAARVLGIALPREGRAARVLVQDASGERFVVAIDPLSTERLMRLSGVLGARVTVVSGATAGTFALDVPDDADAAPAAAPRLSTLKGVVTAREANVLTVSTPDGQLFVAVRPATRILLAASGLPLQSFARGERTVIGHDITVVGSLQPVTGRVIADVVVIGPRADR